MADRSASQPIHLRDILPNVLAEIKLRQEIWQEMGRFNLNNSIDFQKILNAHKILKNINSKEDL